MSDNDDMLRARPAADYNGTLPEKDEGIGEFFKTAILAILLALFIRTFFFEPFNIPSGSMLPTLQIGDYLFVSKTSYGYSQYSFPFGLVHYDGRMMASAPQRGDVVVFKLPTNPSIDYIKRLIGLPGDRIQVKKGRLYINGEMVKREMVRLERVDRSEGGSENITLYIETLPGGVMHQIYEVSDSEQLDNTDEYVVPANHYFMMGDNRDNSRDSRVQDEVGYVPFDNLVGRAEILFFSVDQTGSVFKPWTWVPAIRWNRIFSAIGPARPDDTAAPSLSGPTPESVR